MHKLLYLIAKRAANPSFELRVRQCAQYTNTMYKKVINRKNHAAKRKVLIAERILTKYAKKNSFA